jgi:hypothetical protein
MIHDFLRPIRWDDRCKLHLKARWGGDPRFFHANMTRKHVNSPPFVRSFVGHPFWIPPRAGDILSRHSLSLGLTLVWFHRPESNGSEMIHSVQDEPHMSGSDCFLLHLRRHHTFRHLPCSTDSFPPGCGVLKGIQYEHDERVHNRVDFRKVFWGMTQSGSFENDDGTRWSWINLGLQLRQLVMWFWSLSSIFWPLKKDSVHISENSEEISKFREKYSTWIGCKYNN